MATRLFIDTNILIDFIESTRENHLESLEIMKATIDNDVEIYCSESVITTANYILQKSIPFELLNIIILETLNTVTILPCTNEIVSAALKSKANDLEDAILYEIALENNLDYFITNDKALKKLQTNRLSILTSKQVVKVLHN